MEILGKNQISQRTSKMERWVRVDLMPLGKKFINPFFLISSTSILASNPNETMKSKKLKIVVMENKHKAKDEMENPTTARRILFCFLGPSFFTSLISYCPFFWRSWIIGLMPDFFPLFSLLFH